MLDQRLWLELVEGGGGQNVLAGQSEGLVGYQASEGTPHFRQCSHVPRLLDPDIGGGSNAGRGSF